MSILYRGENVKKVHISILDPVVTQELGDDRSLVMSQKAVSDLFKANPFKGETWEFCSFYDSSDVEAGLDYGWSGERLDRMSIKKVFCFPYDVEISVAEGFKYYLIFQSSAEVDVENETRYTGWLNEPTTIAAGTYFVIIFARQTGDLESKADIENLQVVGYPTIEDVIESFKGNATEPENEPNEGIAARNKDIKHIVQASHNIGRHNTERTQWARKYRECLTLLVGTDFHYDVPRLQNMIDYLNVTEEIDAGVNLGDMQLLKYGDNDGTWYTNIVSASRKEFYTILGNHDMGMWYKDPQTEGTPQEAFNRFIKPTLDKIGISDLSTPYYAKTFDDYKTVVIFLNTYDTPDSIDSGAGEFIVARNNEMFSQAQIDWFIATLNEIPEDYHLVVASHSIGFETTVIDSNFSHKNREYILEMLYPYGYCTIIPDIINAWKSGSTLSESYAPQTHIGLIPTLNANCDFTNRGVGNFACYLVGHQHTDLVLKCAKYDDQKVVALTTASNLTGHYMDSDLPRRSGTKSEDALTVFSIDTDARQIRLVRVGSNITCDMDDRTYTKIDY